eukprot:CAMPEP_0176004268 /NCGR_PEP_ID=MMETSP0120_2-20121206/1603_1 /TAXON_ID=160619 /ORGANISM="Kryptoperidinium foliaceum, Strain CCMP 1326" /LENGTH=460 /DNA_ID=CAMNT_0017336939 /DNA_START=302 /DNA_END=1684 /DNA_ORIENTATION=+
MVCIHVHFGELWQQQVLLGIQTLAAVLFTVGYQTRVMSILSWYMYTSLILRNTWLYFILDRYFYYLLFLAMFLPLDERWSAAARGQKPKARPLVVNPATIGLKLLVFWIYLDAGGGKYLDPLQGWSYNAEPLPALDTYTRHTVGAQYLYGILGPAGLRLMTPLVVYIELLAAPMAFYASFTGNASLLKFAIGMICQLHVGISIALRNSVLLSYVACTAWFVFLPVGWEGAASAKKRSVAARQKLGLFVSALLVGGMAVANIWFETIGTDCTTGSLRKIWSTLLQNRWNVFIGAEEYVTWEIAPGRLADGSIVDVWGRSDEVLWSMPGSGAPCTSTSRPGRWRSFPYLAELEGEDAEALWGYLCKQWDSENDVDHNPGRKLLRYNFFMLQSDVLPNMGFSPTRKRLVHSYQCVDEANAKADVFDRDSGEGDDGDHSTHSVLATDDSGDDEQNSTFDGIPDL